MIPVLLILIPLVAGLAAFFIKRESAVKSWALVASIAALTVSLLGLTLLNHEKYLSQHYNWMQALGAGYTVKLDGLGSVLCLLTTLSYPLILIGTWKTKYSKPSNFFGLLLLSQAGILGVFVAFDALLFYFFWELSLIPMYFLCSQWGGEKRIRVTFKFFIYTFIGSLLMLIGILYLQAQTPDHSFSLQSFYNLALPNKAQFWLFWLFFAAFAVKMPVFPFHTWQPDTYEQSTAAVTMVLSGVMVKMGLLGVIRWILPVFPIASFEWGDVVTGLAVVGIIYASLIAIRQDDLKRLVAYSSIAHMGLMVAAVFAVNKSGMQGAMIQMFNHGINIIGLWILVDIIEKRYGTRKISELGGIAQVAPVMAILCMVLALANIALPLTNSFIGEFLMFNGILAALSKYNILFTFLAGLGIILGAIYILNMFRKVFYGEAKIVGASIDKDLLFNEKLVLGSMVLVILILGVYPQLILNITNEISQSIIHKADIMQFIKK